MAITDLPVSFKCLTCMRNVFTWISVCMHSYSECVYEAYIWVCIHTCMHIEVFGEDSAIQYSRNKNYGKVKYSLELENLKCLFNVSQLLTEGSSRKFTDNTFASYNLYVAVMLGDDWTFIFLDCYSWIPNSQCSLSLIRGLPANIALLCVTVQYCKI